MLNIEGLTAAVGGAWLPMMAFALVTSISPGPVNIVAAASGMNFGFMRTVPQILGATMGFSMLLALMGFGFARLLHQHAGLYSGLKYVGAAFLLYMAAKIALAGTVDFFKVGAQFGRPPTLWDGLLAQWLNPKAWIVSATGVTTYAQAGDAYRGSVLALVIVFFAVCFPSISAWAVFGQSVHRIFRSESAVRKFNLTMGLLLVLSIAGVFA